MATVIKLEKESPFPQIVASFDPGSSQYVLNSTQSTASAEADSPEYVIISHENEAILS